MVTQPGLTVCTTNQAIFIPFFSIYDYFGLKRPIKWSFYDLIPYDTLPNL